MKNNSKLSDGNAGAGGRGKYQALPKGWQCVKLGDIATIRKEKFIITANNNHLPCIELEHIEKHSGKIIATASVANKLSIKNTFYAGDVLYGKLRPNLRKYAFPQFKGVCASEIWALKVNTDFCINKFLFYVIQSEKFTEVACRTTGTKMPRADWSLLRNFSIFIPNKNTQNKIVSILETWDTAIEKTERLIAAKEKHFKYLLKTLINKTEQNKKQYSTSLENLTYSEIVIEKGKPIKATGTTKGDIPVIAGGKTSPYTHNKYTHNYPCITVSSSGAYAGYIWLHSNSIWASDCIVIYSKEGSTDYLYYALKLQQQKIYAMKIGSGQPHVYPKDLKKITIPLPSIRRQKQIANILNMAKQEITTLQSIAEKYRTQKRGLMQKLLKGA